MNLAQTMSRLKVLHPGLAPEWGKEIFLQLRRLNAHQRAMPDFLVIGAQKSGSTSLFNYLSLHPQVLPAIQKEIFYFSRFYGKGELWYRRYFPVQRSMAKMGAITGEGSTMYLCDPAVPERVARDRPGVKWIAVLRHPGHRAISHFYHRQRAGREHRALNDVFTEVNLKAWRDGGLLPENDRLYFERGDYAAQLNRWFNALPEAQGRVLIAEEMFADLEASVAKVQQFLNLENVELGLNRSFNKGEYDRSCVDRLGAKINRSFIERNEKLAVLLGRELPW